MIKSDKKILPFFLLILFMLIPLNGFSQQSPLIQKGIDEYKDESYEEAIVTLTKARTEDPESSVAAFFLGMAYKQTIDYEKSLKNLLDAVNLTPRIKEALVEVVDVSTQLGKLDTAKEWIAVAERENISPAKTAFLKGVILKKEGKTKEAAEAFAKAKSIDPKMSQASDIQIALSHVSDRRLNDAKKSFEAAIVNDPQSDLAEFARQYLDAVEQRIRNEKPFRFTLGIYGQYDDNMVLKPNDQTAAVGITNESSAVLNTLFRVNYAPILKGQWLFNAQDAIGSSLHDKNSHTHDSLINSLSITPGYNFGDYALYFSTSYNRALVRNPDYEGYSGSLSTGPLFRMAIKENQLVEIFTGYTNDKYFRDPLAPEEDRDSNGYRSYISWLWLIKKDYFLNLKFQADRRDTDGRNWDNSSFGFSVNYAMPIYGNFKLQLSGQYTDQDFDNQHTFAHVAREDTMYVFSGGVTWNWKKDFAIVTQYKRVRTDSNIGIYDYTRNIGTLGIEYRF
jgi:tetratricopeptide (TPR) repeat protein